MNVIFNDYKRLVLSGGGSRGLAILGALHYIYENGGIKNIDEYWGTSVGSVISLLLLIGYTPFEAFHQFFMLEHLADPSTLNINSLIEEYAICPIETFGNKVRYFIEKKLGKGSDPTFQDLYTIFNKKIHIIGANTTTMKGECFDVDTKPLMKIVDAIEISCDLPYIFTKKHFEGSIYVDGGFINNYAVNLADDGDTLCLGICVFGDIMTNNNEFIGWIYRLMYMPIMELHRERVSKLSEKFTNIELIINNLNMIEMSPNRRKKIEVFSAGYQQARTFLAVLTEKTDNDWDVDFDFDWSDSEQ